jgi:hypothetical protein
MAPKAQFADSSKLTAVISAGGSVDQTVSATCVFDAAPAQIVKFADVRMICASCS